MNDNKRIAKNTFLLYIRTFITLIISLYTSRIILHQLGVSDYGVFTVVGGFIAMLSALMSPLGGATQRFITFSIGTKDINNVKKTFTAAVYVHGILAFVSFVFIEIIGIWYINNKLNIPESRIYAAFFIFQTSLVSYIVQLICIPCNAAVVAYEKFSFFAWISIIQSLLKLILVSLLSYISFDKLIIYGILDTSVIILANFSFVYYCFRYLEGCRFIRVNESKLFSDILRFSGWNYLGTTSSLFYTQGSSLLLNYYWGVLLNAAMGVTNQVSAAVTSFVANFSMAVNPQITKKYAEKDYVRTNELVIIGAKLSSFLLLLVGIPVINNLKYLLGLWLVDVPDYSEGFIILSLVLAFVSSFINPLNCLIFATGNIKYYQICCVVINTVSLCLLLASFAYHLHPNYIYIIAIVQSLIKTSVVLYIAKQISLFPITSFLKEVYFRSFICAAAIIPFLFIKEIFLYKTNMASFILETVFLVVFEGVIIYAIGLSKAERKYVKNLLISKIR